MGKVVAFKNKFDFVDEANNPVIIRKTGLTTGGLTEHQNYHILTMSKYYIYKTKGSKGYAL
jgi:hypothetical protein